MVSVVLREGIDLWVFNQPGAAPTIKRQLEYHQAHAVRKSERPLVTEGSAELWHRRLAHIQPSTVKKAAGMVDGIKITGNEELKEDQQLCEVCKMAHAPRQISRRDIGKTFGRFGKVYFDLIQFHDAYNGHKWITHFYVEGIRFHWVFTYQHKSEVRDAIKKFIALAKN